MLYTVGTCARALEGKPKDIFLLLSFEYNDGALNFLSVQKMHFETIVPDGMFTLTTWISAPEYDTWAAEWLITNGERLKEAINGLPNF